MNRWPDLAIDAVMPFAYAPLHLGLKSDWAVLRLLGLVLSFPWLPVTIAVLVLVVLPLVFASMVSAVWHGDI